MFKSNFDITSLVLLVIFLRILEPHLSRKAYSIDMKRIIIMTSKHNTFWKIILRGSTCRLCD